MSLFKKVLGSLVELEESPEKPSETPEEGDMSMDDLEKLLAESPRPSQAKVEAPAPAAPPVAQPSPMSGLVMPPASAPAPVKPSFAYTIEDVYREASLPKGKNTAIAVMKLLEALANFEVHQQRKMIRAMDEVDDDWDEPTVLMDARRRIAALDHFRNHINQDLIKHGQEIQAKHAKTQAEVQNHLSEIDRRIATLQSQRDEAQRRLASSQTHAQDELHNLEGRATSLRQTIEQARSQLDQLINFFSA